MSSLADAIDLVSNDSPSDEGPHDSYDCCLPGQPKAMGRPRYRKFQGFYNPTKKELNKYKAVLLERRTELFWKPDVVYPKGVPVMVRLDCQMRRPKIHFKSGGVRSFDRLKNWAKQMIGCTTSPDIDNIAKLVMDAMNGVIYFDDRQVVQLEVTKTYSNSGDCSGHIHVQVDPY